VNMVPVYITGWIVVGAAVWSMSQCQMKVEGDRIAAKSAIAAQCAKEGFAWETSWDGWCNRSVTIPKPL